MSYTYVATSWRDESILVAYPRKHELARWCQYEANHGYPNGGWMELLRVRNQGLGERATLTELELIDGELIEKGA